MLHWGEGRAANIVPFGSAKCDAPARSLAEAIREAGVLLTCSRNAEIFSENDPADSVYTVVSGAVRICKLMSDGRRQIGAFHLPGDVFGLESETVHDFSAEAIGDCAIRAVKRKTLLAAPGIRLRILSQICAETTTHLQRAQQHILLLGRKTAQERVATFLLDMAARLSRHGEIVLPMSRQDIGDYLGLTIETVSRTLTQLERDGLIVIRGSRRIAFRDRAALDVMNDGSIAA